MKNLLLASWGSSYMLLIILVVVIVAFLLLSLYRRKKESSFREDLNSKLVPGAEVKTYSGLYGTIVSITDTTDGKIVLLQTGEGDKVSYQQIHINAIFGLDTKKELVFDENGNDITFGANDVQEVEEEVEYEEDDEIIEEYEELDEEDEVEEVVEEEVVEEEVVEEKPKKSAKKPSTSAKKSTKST
jgi:preprotein translocase YajC subunit